MAFLLLVAIYYIILITPIGVAIWWSWSLRKHPQPPLSAACIILLTGGSLPALHLTQGIPFAGDIKTTALIFGGAAICGAAALSLMLRRLLRLPPVKAWAASIAILAAGLVWLDLKFCVIVTDTAGNPVEVDSKQIGLSYDAPSWGTSVLQQVPGKRLSKGRIYFGFLHWARFPSKWIIWGSVSSNGQSIAPFHDRPAAWSEWPVHVTVPPSEVPGL